MPQELLHYFNKADGEKKTKENFPFVFFSLITGTLALGVYLAPGTFYKETEVLVFIKSMCLMLCDEDK